MAWSINGPISRKPAGQLLADLAHVEAAVAGSGRVEIARNTAATISECDLGHVRQQSARERRPTPTPLMPRPWKQRRNAATPPAC